MKRKTSRKKYYEKPLHLRRKDVKAHISKEVKEKLKINKRAVVLKKGDKVKVVRGSNKGKEGKIIRVSYVKRKIYIEGIAKQTSRGTEKPIPIEPSNVIITELNLDESRKKKLGMEG